MLPTGDVLGKEITERKLRFTLEQSFYDLAAHTDDDDRHDTMIDLANTVRPKTLW
jgi:hypothetical protein